MDKNNGKVKLNDELLDRVSGGVQGDVGSTAVFYICPFCGVQKYIRTDCESGTIWIHCECGKQFTINI